jgi:MoaA/NifB/PqqE/SkfB family radical SAM enzyme
VSNKKILCLGNNSEDTDTRSKLLAHQQGMFYHGLITEIKNVAPGCYQTSIYDMSYGDLIELSKNIDEVIILDQPKESYQDDHAFYQTISLGKHLKSICNVVFLDQTFNKTIEDELKINKSICILPFIQSVVINNHFHLCCYANKPMSKFDPSIKYSDDPKRNIVKQKMLSGDKLDYCKSCYDLEDVKIISPRITQTVEWADRLSIKSKNEFITLNSPTYYEIRASNQCNLMCRMCIPANSNLIENENKKLKLFNDSNFQYTGFNHVDINKVEKLYVAGGEPTIMPEFYTFLEKCIAKKKTNIEIQINTNAVSLTKKFKSLLKFFNNVSFEISVDGYKLVNEYVRWPTNWEKLINNIDYIHNIGHNISFNSVVSIYNIASLHSIIEFLNIRYKKVPIHLSLVSFEGDILSPYIFPNDELVINNLSKIKKLDIYRNDPVFRSKIDTYLNYFINDHQIDLTKLELFFKYNDQLDTYRNSRLVDYIPELEQFRKLLNKE